MATNVTLSGSVRSNLLALQRTQGAVDVTNSRLNTGKKVNTVIDDAVAFFSAKALDDRASDFNDRKANIDQAISAINTALTATTAIDSLVKQLKGIVTSAKSATAIERGAFQTQFNTVKSQIDQLVNDATYQGLNLVANSTAKQTTQFSERSSSLLSVSAQRLTTYKTTTARASQIACNLNATIASAGGVSQYQYGGSAVQLVAGAAGIYYVAGISSQTSNNRGLETYTLVRYNNTTASQTITSAGAATGSNNDIGVGGGNSAIVTALTSRAQAAYVASREVENIAASTAAIFQTEFNVASGLSIFAASQIYIFVDAGLTGSFGVTTFSTGTLWSASDFVAGTGLASDQFSEALDGIVRGLDAALSQNNSVAKALGTNVAILNTRLEFTKEYVNVQKEGSGKLVLADTNEEGANLVSLQTRQQLGIQALQFAGQTEQSVLRLFG